MRSSASGAGTAGVGSEAAFLGPSLRLATALAAGAVQALGAQCNGRIAMQRSETRAQTSIPEQRARPHGPLHPGLVSCREEPAADENIERKWPLAHDGRALPAINFDWNGLD